MFLAVLKKIVDLADYQVRNANDQMCISTESRIINTRIEMWAAQWRMEPNSYDDKIL
jgi:hypothetical protein